MDTGIETGCPSPTNCSLLYFASPIVPDLGANYGGAASFDLRSSVSPRFAAELLIFPSGPSYLDVVIAEIGGTTYHHLSIVLRESSDWSVCPYAGGICTAATQSDFRNLIGASDQIAVMADVGPNGTGETYDLDNVTLTDGPPPAAPPPHPVPTARRSARRSATPPRRRSARRRSITPPAWRLRG